MMHSGERRTRHEPTAARDRAGPDAVPAPPTLRCPPGPPPRPAARGREARAATRRVFHGALQLPGCGGGKNGTRLGLLWTTTNRMRSSHSFSVGTRLVTPPCMLLSEERLARVFFRSNCRSERTYTWATF